MKIFASLEYENLTNEICEILNSERYKISTELTEE
jgi:hypothetical protein